MKASFVLVPNCYFTCFYLYHNLKVCLSLESKYNLTYVYFVIWMFGVYTVKNKGGKDDSSGGGTGGSLMHGSNGSGRSIDKLKIRPRGEEENDGGSVHHYSDSESPSNSPTSHASSVLGGNDSGTTFTGSSSSSTSSGGCCSGSLSEEDDDCLDDWEAVADALAASDEKQEQKESTPNSSPENKSAGLVDAPPEVTNQQISDTNEFKPKLEDGVPLQTNVVNCRAWRVDDALRPQSLPNLSKQFSFPMNSDRRYGCGGSVWGCKNVASAPTSCPICYEDLDFTDSSFLPCSCGFRLCLFCHKRILEEDGRCPGCRKQYHPDPVEGEATFDGGSLTYRLARSCSMITRS